MFTLSIIPSHFIATWLLETITSLLKIFTPTPHVIVVQIIYFIVILAVSVVIGFIIRKLLLFVMRRIVSIRNSDFSKELLRQRTMAKCSHVIPPLVFMALIPFAFDSASPLLHIMYRVAIAYMLLMVAMGVCAVFNLFFTRYDQKENTKNLPLKGVSNIIKGVVWAIFIICAVSVVVDKSPAALLGGLTAFAAVLMLIFKDTIQGFVAGVQMSQNDMLHVGDWIVVPSTPANGVVTDVSLSTVKVLNFDNTTVMVPPYTLVSTSFQNWRSMSESGRRRIAMSIYVSPKSIEHCTPDSIKQACETFPLLNDFVQGLQKAGSTVAWDKGNAPLNGTIETNLGLYRAYMTAYLKQSPMIDNTLDLMLSIQPPTAEGVPMQIYCFSVTTQWEAYEAVKSAVMEHAMMAAPKLGLAVLTADYISVGQTAVAE